MKHTNFTQEIQISKPKYLPHIVFGSVGIAVGVMIISCAVIYVVVAGMEAVMY
jgi:hypothetical protein